MAKVEVAIATFRRPRGLARLLFALEKLETSADVSVLVADNDAENHEGFKLCQHLRAKNRWPLEAIIVPERGIAQVRNALSEHILENSSAQFIAMLDDDEWPDPQWLEAFLRVQQDTDADALHGAIARVFEATPAVWALRCQGIAPLHNATGSTDMIEGSGNIFFRRACLENLSKPYFDPAFALTGGEDRDFFVRLRAAGMRFAWADEAIAYAHVPASRTSLSWILSRAYRVGNSDMRVFLKHPYGAFAFAREIVKIGGALLLFPFLLVILALNPNRRAEPMCKLFRGTGKIAAVLGRYYNEYAVTHGE